MNLEKLHSIFDNLPEGKDHISFDGKCCDCDKEAEIIIYPAENGFKISGGAVYEFEAGHKKIKCEKCYDIEPVYKNSCEVYTRTVGYYRPIDNMSKSKQKEISDRKMFNLYKDKNK